MKILHVTRERAADQRYGLGRSLAPILDALQQRGHSVSYICQEDLGPKSLAWVGKLNRSLHRLLPVRSTNTQWDYLIAGLTERLNMGRVAAKLARSGRYTHVHFHDPFMAFGYRLFRGIRFDQVRWGFTEHGYGSYTQAFHEDGAILGTDAFFLMRALERRITLKAHWVFSPTRSSLAQLQRDLGLYPQPAHCHVVPHAKPLMPKMDKRLAREALGWSQDKTYVLAVGRLVEIKNFPLIFRAFKALEQPHLSLVIMGEGDRDVLFDLARSLGFEDRLIMTSDLSMAAYYSAADLYISGSRSESFGLANLEAMTFGLPIISTLVGGVPDVLSSAAHWVPSDDVDAMAHALNKLIEDDDHRQALRTIALERAQAWPDSQAIAERYESIYQHAV
ncbi:MAG: glycosyltransferase family 4 protein [Methylococcus sp.]